MVLHRGNPENFKGPGGNDYDPETMRAEAIRAELVALASQCCLEHSAKIVNKILEDYKVAPRRGRKYP